MKTIRKNRFRLVNIVGIDGAGKTTLARSLADALAGTDPQVRYCYSQYFAKLLYPVKYMAKLIFMRKTDEFGDYTTYNRTKKKTSSRYPRLSSLYSLIWLLDYSIQVFFKITAQVLMGRRLIIDRYIFDIAVNLSLTSNQGVEYAQKLIDRFFRYNLVPDLVLFVDLPEAIAFERKDDIQDIEYLKERRERYLWLAECYGFTVIDGTLPREQVLGAAMAALRETDKDHGIDNSGNRSGMHRKPRTILYVHANNTDIGGADYCLFKLASQLDKTKFRPVVCLGRETQILDLYKKEGIKTYVINMERIKRSFNPFYLVKLVVKFFPTISILRDIIRKENVDIVHGNDLLDIYGPVAGRLENKPTTQYVRWIIESPWVLKMVITRVVYLLNDSVMTVSDGVAKAMFAIKGKVLPRVVTCYDWIDMGKTGHHRQGSDIRREYHLSEETPLVGCVGRLEFWKGQEVFVRAARHVLDQIPDARFLVVGGNVSGRGRESYGKRCRALAEALGIKKQVIFTGHRSDIADVMGALDVFVHASVTPDPLPGVVMEAMACSVPVVGADAGGVPEEMENMKTGFLYPPGDARQMSDRIAWLLKHPNEAAQMGTAGRRRVLSKFEKTRLCRVIERHYEFMIEKRAGNGQTIVMPEILELQPAEPAGKGNRHVQNI